MGRNRLMGVDIGTYSAKGVLTTPEGEVLAEVTVEHEMSVPRPGWAEHDPERIWWGEFCRISRELLQQSGSAAGDVAGVGVSAIGPAVVPVDRNGRALRQGILYGVDTRATKEIQDLKDRYGADVMYAQTGSALSSQAAGPKIMWLSRHEPDIYREAAYFHSASDFIVQRLTGEHVMDAYTASSYLPLFDITAGDWSKRFADQIVAVERLPTVKWSTDLAGEVTTQAAGECGLAAGTPVTTGTVDAVAEAVSVGAIHPGDLMLMYGTTAFLILATDHIINHPAM